MRVFITFAYEVSAHNMQALREQMTVFQITADPSPLSTHIAQTHTLGKPASHLAWKSCGTSAQPSTRIVSGSTRFSMCAKSCSCCHPGNGASTFPLDRSSSATTCMAGICCDILPTATTTTRNVAPTNCALRVTTLLKTSWTCCQLCP